MTNTPNTRLVRAIRLKGFGEVFIPDYGIVKEGDVYLMPEDEALARADFQVLGQVEEKPLIPPKIQNIPARATTDNTSPPPTEEPEKDD